MRRAGVVRLKNDISIKPPSLSLTQHLWCFSFTRTKDVASQALLTETFSLWKSFQSSEDLCDYFWNQYENLIFAADVTDVINVSNVSSSLDDERQSCSGWIIVECALIKISHIFTREMAWKTLHNRFLQKINFIFEILWWKVMSSDSFCDTCLWKFTFILSQLTGLTFYATGPWYGRCYILCFPLSKAPKIHFVWHAASLWTNFWI